MAGTISWQDLEVAMGGRALLHAHSGVARAGRLLGVLGPSGSGKTTLLGAIAGMLPARASISGAVRCDGAAKVSVAEGTVALLEQDDSFFSELTVRETLCFAAELEARRHHDAALCADSLLRKVGLAHIAGCRIGNRADSSDRHGGVTKGERRRLAVACAIVGEEMDWCEGGGGMPHERPRRSRALLADEPTTGLDAFQAARVVALLHDLALARNCAAMATLHQPRASIWAMLDDVMLVAPGGHIVYCGPREEVLLYFAGLEHACPREGVNPAEFLIDMISVDTEDLECAAKAHAHIASLATAFRSSSQSTALHSWLKDDRERAPHPHTSSGNRIGPCRAFRLLLRRSLIQMIRDKFTASLRLLAIAGLAVIFGLHFGKLDGGGLPTARSVASRICLLSFGAIAMAMLALARALDRFTKERAVVARERAARRYRGAVYLTAKVVCELPSDAAVSALFAAIVHEQCGLQAELPLVVGAFALVAIACASLGLAIGAASPRAETALAVGGPVMAVHMLTGVIDPAGQAGHDPIGIILLLRSLSPIRHGIEALCVAELKGMTLARSAVDAPRMGGLALVRTGDEVLKRLDVVSSFEGCLLWLGALTCLHLVAAAVALTLTSPRYSRTSSKTSPGAFCQASVADRRTIVPLQK